MDVKVVGWHIHPEAGICENCGQPATVLVENKDPEGYFEIFNLCNECLKKHNVVEDQIAKVFRDLGL